MVFDYIRNALTDSKYLSILGSLSNAIDEYEFDEALELSNKLEELVKESIYNISLEENYG